MASGVAPRPEPGWRGCPTHDDEDRSSLGRYGPIVPANGPRRVSLRDHIFRTTREHQLDALSPRGEWSSRSVRRSAAVFVDGSPSASNRASIGPARARDPIVKSRSVTTDPGTPRGSSRTAATGALRPPRSDAPSRTGRLAGLPRLRIQRDAAPCFTVAGGFREPLPAPASPCIGTQHRWRAQARSRAR